MSRRWKTTRLVTAGRACATAAALILLVCRVAVPQTNSNPLRFVAAEIYLDTQGQPLAAYQIEFRASGGARIVGIEGGEHPAFADPPCYDPKAMQQERVIIAAYSTRPPDKLPRGKTRVATIHLQVTGLVEPEFALQLQAAADMTGARIPGRASVQPAHHQ